MFLFFQISFIRLKTLDKLGAIVHVAKFKKPCSSVLIQFINMYYIFSHTYISYLSSAQQQIMGGRSLVKSWLKCLGNCPPCNMPSLQHKNITLRFIPAFLLFTSKLNIYIFHIIFKWHKYSIVKKRQNERRESFILKWMLWMSRHIREGGVSLPLVLSRWVYSGVNDNAANNVWRTEETSQVATRKVAEIANCNTLRGNVDSREWSVVTFVWLI